MVRYVYTFQNILQRTENDMEQADGIRYSVSMKKGYRIFCGIFSILMFAASVMCAFWGIGKCETLLNYSAVLFCILFFILVGCVCIFSITKRVEIYKGKIVYYNGFWKKEYRMSDICTSKTQEESFDIHNDVNAVNGTSWDMVTTFYDAAGKKLFKFGLAYQNTERLQKDAQNAQKSIQGIQNNENKKSK